MTQLHHPLGTRQITQRMGAQIGQPHTGRKPVDHQLLCRAGQYGLTAVRQIAQPRCPVDRRPDVVAFVAQLYLTGMDTDA